MSQGSGNGGTVTGGLKIIAVGDELLEGRTADTNSGRIQRALGGHALRCELIQVVPDQEDAIRRALDRTAPGDLVFLTGGLGSTPDDLTRDALAAWAGVPLEEDAMVRAELEERWRRRGVHTRPGVERQCQVPRGLVTLANPVGSAPGLVGRLQGRLFALLPGVPPELEGLLPLVVDWLEGEGALPTMRATLTWRTAQIAELNLVRRCEAARAAFPGMGWSWWLSDWGVDVRVSAGQHEAPEAAEAALAEVGRMLDAAFGRLVYARDRRDLPTVVQQLAVDRKRTLAVAESCTGGLVGGALTAVPGASACFRGGVLAYADDMKTAHLGVPAAVLASDGAVSEATVRAMAAGCRERCGADLAVAVSGISGPSGGTVDKPVGTTWIGIATPTAVFAGGYRFAGDRARNRLVTVAAALDALRRVLEEGDDASPWGHGDTWWKI
ncbi:MAG: nicotinamide-nucleotide amidohydrolase family protein [bacterium]|nr:nicotinamide-nucleotide amidohydrolase family protein [bacterium]